ncbi:MAG: YiiX/YebB-like N1pC/P60 family cysteine hydrolase [Pirellula sp.]
MMLPTKDPQQWLEEATRTVLSVHRQFDELKSAADAMAAYAATLDRDYLTPTEDEAARRMLVTYWQLRNALLEIVHELRGFGKRDRKLYKRMFLPGYAGALVLVDAARFLRDRFHRWPLIRAKLNEPEPAFGIPAGVYDTTQSSWTKPQHIWELFDAAAYYRKHASTWNASREVPEMAALLDIIERLTGRLQITWGDYAKVRLRFRARQLLGFLKHDVLGLSLFQVQKVAGVLAADKYLKIGHQPNLPASIREELLQELAPGDILLVRKEYALTNYFLPGYWPHAALFLGNVRAMQGMGLEQNSAVASRWQKILDCDAPECGRVLEAMKDGVHVRGMESPFGSDSILVLRPKLSSEAIQQAVARALLHEGKEYDFNFDFTKSDRMVCTEVIYRAYDGIEGMRFPLALRAGRLTLASAELIQMGIDGRCLEIRATYIPTLRSKVLRDSEALRAVREANPTLSAAVDSHSSSEGPSP